MWCLQNKNSAKTVDLMTSISKMSIIFILHYKLQVKFKIILSIRNISQWKVDNITFPNSTGKIYFLAPDFADTRNWSSRQNRSACPAKKNNWKHCFLLFITEVGLTYLLFNVFKLKVFVMRLLWSECCLNV